jgi:hypothetical protein
MKPSDSNDSFSRTLADWQMTPKADPNFRPAVWQRIKQRSHETWFAYLRAHLVPWSLAGAAALVAAGWTGHSFARAKLDSSREQMVVSYLGDLDPRVMAKLRP